MLKLLEKLRVDTIQYRRAIDELFSPALTTSVMWRACFAEIQLSTAQLYLDYLLLARGMQELQLLARPSGSGNSTPSSDNVRERKLREELMQRLNASDGWPGFIPRNAFSDLTGFSTLRDYVGTFHLHLPEIYEESFRVEAYAERFLADHNEATLAMLSVALEHLGRNHASFVLQPLGWAADELSWED